MRKQQISVADIKSLVLNIFKVPIRYPSREVKTEKKTKRGWFPGRNYFKEKSMISCVENSQ